MAKKKEDKEDKVATAIGQALKELRKEKGLSQSDVYFKAGIERGTFQRYDAGHVSRPSIVNLIKIAEVMEITPGAIIDKAYEILKITEK